MQTGLLHTRAHGPQVHTRHACAMVSGVGASLPRPGAALTLTARAVPTLAPRTPLTLTWSAESAWLVAAAECACERERLGRAAALLLDCSVLRPSPLALADGTAAVAATDEAAAAWLPLL